MWNGSRATTPIMRPTRSAGLGSRRTSRIASNTSALPAPDPTVSAWPALYLPRRAHAFGALPKIGRQRANIIVVLREKSAEILLLGDGKVEAGHHDIDHVIAAIAAIDAKIDFDRLLSRSRMWIDQHRAHQFVARSPLHGTRH